MFCRTCGKEIINEAVVCPYCGCLTGVPQQPPINYNNGYVNNGTNVDQYGNPINTQYINADKPSQSEPDEINAGIAIVSFLFPIIGIIMGAINISQNKKKSGKFYLIMGLASWGLLFILGIVLMGVGFSIASAF